MDSKIHAKLLRAVNKGDVTTAELLLNSFDRFHLTQYYETTTGRQSMLHVAVGIGQNRMIELLLKYFDVNSIVTKSKKQASRITTPLMIAIEENHDETVKLLLNHGADFSIPERSDYIELLQRACIKGHGGMVKILLEHGLRIYSNPQELDSSLGPQHSKPKWKETLEGIVDKSRREIIQMLLSCENENNRRKIFEAALQTATCVSKDIDKVKIILSLGAEESLANQTLNKGLIYSSGLSTIAIVQFFLDNGADVNYCNLEEGNYGPLRAAVAYGREDVVQLLLDNGANPNNTFGDAEETALTWAVKRGNRRMVESMLNNGADINLGAGKSDYLVYHKYYPEWKDHMEVSKAIVRHIVDLQDGGMFVDRCHLTNIESDEELRCFKDKCTNEIKSIKEFKFDDSVVVSLYDAWKTKDLIRLAGYMKNENIAGFLRSKDFYKKFPMYFELMRVKFDKGFERIYLQRRVCNFFWILSIRKENQLPKLPAICVNQIFNCLNNEDLINLRDAYF